MSCHNPVHSPRCNLHSALEEYKEFDVSGAGQSSMVLDNSEQESVRRLDGGTVGQVIRSAVEGIEAGDSQGIVEGLVV